MSDPSAIKVQPWTLFWWGECALVTSDLREGAVVRWNGNDGFGVVERIVGRRIEVRWDTPTERTPSVFAVTNAPLTRVVLPASASAEHGPGGDTWSTYQRGPAEMEGHGSRTGGISGEGRPRS